MVETFWEHLISITMKIITRQPKKKLQNMSTGCVILQYMNRCHVLFTICIPVVLMNVFMHVCECIYAC